MSSSPSKPLPQKTRRTHTKSRGGCMECKRRKLKCNEAKPVCGGCTKREITCVYPKVGSRTPLSKDAGQVLRPSTSLSVANALNGPATTSSPNVAVQEESSDAAAPARGIGQFDMKDMGLWHQFIYSTAATLSNPWGHELPGLALNCDYLLHGMLALGALHLAYLNPAKRESYSILASHHYDLAIGPFHRATKSVTPDNANQIFAFSTLLVVINYASDRSPELIFPFADGEAHDGLSNWMVDLRGCGIIFETASAHVIEQGPLGFLITQGKRLQEVLSTGAQPTPEDDRSLARIKDEVLNLTSVKTSTTVEEMEAYHDAIERLRALLAASTQPLDSVIKRAVCSIWPSRVSDTFVRLLSEKRPPAMIILAHYCLLLRGLEECWYMERRGVNLFQIVVGALDNEWAIYVDHPRREFT
ncbi:uncharacterized protein LY89DRAFT_262682 [Mollisia scopiformis]|uniref:Zn(2)-C6 fungal-type domain-containing protein n=1 Tax=Mollisia scopiformis TaxID=149040 RepID=A0A132BDL9_MOLSC|nr:uncharacterized protein LY89DRAFT_262682 [Mollisia scopiformis]KUJ10496.1 hypothetical protein LY89DRAFT_262682 [Mollisia scopiformis]